MLAIRKALVTGGSGFIGRHLCALLESRGIAVRALMRNASQGPWEEQRQCDIAEGVPVEAFADIDALFHLAGKAHATDELAADENEYRRVNLAGTRHLLSGARRAGVSRLVFFSSVKAMGEGSASLESEETTPAPQSAYGRTKLEAENEWLSSPDAHAVVLRLPLVYGPGVKGNLASMLEAVAGGRFPPLAVENRRSMVHVEDAARAALLAASCPRAKGQVYIVTDGKQYSTGEIYALMRSALGRPVPRWRVPIWLLHMAAGVGDLIGTLGGRRFVIDSRSVGKLTGSAAYSSHRIASQLDFAPLHSLQSTVPEMVRHYRGELMTETGGHVAQ